MVMNSISKYYTCLHIIIFLYRNIFKFLTYINLNYIILINKKIQNLVLNIFYFKKNIFYICRYKPNCEQNCALQKFISYIFFCTRHFSYIYAVVALSQRKRNYLWLSGRWYYNRICIFSDISLCSHNFKKEASSFNIFIHYCRTGIFDGCGLIFQNTGT